MTLLNTVRSWLSARAADAKQPDPISKVILSSARDRWMAADVRCYTPDRVVSVLRGAFSGDLCAQWELFDLMEGTSPRIAKNFAELKQTLEDFEWPLEAWSADGQEPSNEALRRKHVVEDVLWHFEPDPTLDENDFSDMCRDMADAWGKGLAVQEIDWTPRQIDGAVGVGIKATRWVHPRNYGYAEDETGADRLMLKASELMRQSKTADSKALAAGLWTPFPKDKFLIGLAKQKTGHPIGAALLRPLAWWWAVSNFIGEWLVNLAQIFGVPIRWANYAQSANPEQIRRIEEMLENMGSSAWGAFPAGTTLELKEALKAGQDNPQIAILNIFDKMADLLILGQSITGDAGQGGGGLGHENNLKAQILSGRKKALLKWAVKTLNQQLIPAICRMNFGDTAEMPYFVCGEEDEEDTKKVAETFEIAVRSGIPLKKDFALQKLGWPKPAKGDEVIEPKSAAPMPGPGNQIPDGGSTTVDGQQAQARAARVAAAAAQDKLVASVMEDLTGVEARWLGGVKPFFVRLVAAAQSDLLSDADFEQVIEKARRQMPELFGALDVAHLEDAMVKAMGAAAVNGAVDGYMKRKAKKV